MRTSLISRAGTCISRSYLDRCEMEIKVVLHLLFCGVLLLESLQNSTEYSCFAPT